MNSISSICKRCGKPSPSDNFVLDRDVGMMICPNCVLELRKSAKAKSAPSGQKISNTPIAPNSSKKPVDWDEDDEYLLRAKKEKPVIETPSFPKLDEERIKYTCKCGYSFAYNTFKEYPKLCPYCKKPVDV